ncbi:MAG: hypothetical protein C5B54_02440 [Acidobacteria bacterium]|nr:MAG: hypothetical protein C5B54_02440 [Acidobacteriota bacterium]
MQLTLLSGYPDNVGRRHIWCGWGKGPEHYNHITKDPLAAPRFQFYFDSVFPAVSKSGEYIVYGFAAGVGARLEWKLIWKHFSGLQIGQEVTQGHDLSHEEVQLSGFGGQF